MVLQMCCLSLKWLEGMHAKRILTKGASCITQLKYHKSSIIPLLGVRGGGGVVFNLAKMMVSVLPKELEYEVEKLKYKKLEVKLQPRITNKSELPVGEKTILNPHDVL